MGKPDPVAELGRANARFVPPPGPSNRTDGILTLLVYAVALSLYLGYLTVHHSYDAVAGAILLYQWIANGAAAQLFHKYHILYLPLGAVVETALAKLGWTADPLTLLQAINAFFAAGAVALFYRLSRRLGLDRPLSLVLVTLFGFGFSFWYYASDAESYAVSIFFLLLAFLSALALPPHASHGRIARPGIWLGVAVGFHITCVLALPALLLAAWPGPSCEKPLRRPVIVLLATVVLAVTPYAATYVHFERTDPISGFSADLEATVDPGYRGTVWWSVDPENVKRQWLGLADAMAPQAWPAAATSFPRLVALLGFGLLALTLLPLALLLPRRGRVHGVWMLVAWFLAAFLFFSTYNVASAKFASYQWAPLLLLVGLALRGLKPMRKAHGVAFGFLVVLAVGTLASSFDIVGAQTRASGNPHLKLALAIAQHTEPEDVVVYLGRGETQHQKVYTPYFAVRRSIVLDSYFDKSRRSGPEAMRAVGDRIAEQLRLERRVVVLADAAEATASRREFEQFHGLPPGSLDGLFAEFQPRVVAADPDLGRLWSLDGPRFAPASR